MIRLSILFLSIFSLIYGIYFIFFPFPIKAKWLVIGYGFFELWSGFNTSDNIAHFAHLGGMLFGYILIKYWNKNRTYFY